MAERKSFIDDAAFIADYCKKHYPEHVEDVLVHANLVLEHKFWFNTENDLEQIDDPISYDEIIDWEYKPGDDQEYVWQFNRHRCFITLGQAYQYTKDERYAKCYVELLTSFIKDNPFDCENPEHDHRRNTTWRILEAGFRGEYWTKAYAYFKDSPSFTEEVKALYEESLHAHAKYLISMHSPYRMISNWGVIENHGLFNIAMALPEGEKTAYYAKTAMDHLTTLSRMAVMPDGVEWEQSPMYHNEVLKGYLDVIALAQKNGVEIPEAFLDCAKRMARADLVWQKPNHYQFINGDSDDFSIAPFLCRAAVILNQPECKFGAEEIPDYESCWDLGREGIEAYEKMEAKCPEFLSEALADTGNYYFRSGWEKDSNLMHMHCGTIGAGHGHSDKLHLDLVVRGEDVLVDGGRYSYVTGPKRFEYKDPGMHNTITVDGQLFTICKDSWECTKLSQPVRQQFVKGKDYEFVQGGHLGYTDIGVYVNRKVVYIRPDIYIVMDECYGAEHAYESYYHFSERGEVELQDKKVIFHGEKGDTTFHYLSDVALRKDASHIARKYNHEEDNVRITASWSGSGCASNLVIMDATNEAQVEKIPVSSALKKIQYPNSMAEAVKITTKEKEYVVIICHQEVNSPTDLVEADGCLGFGNVIVFDKKETTEIGHTLVW